jgi:hypothetical protein
MYALKERLFTLTSYSFCISTPILELESTIFVIRNCKLDETILNPIQRVRIACVGPHTLSSLEKCESKFEAYQHQYLTVSCCVCTVC